LEKIYRYVDICEHIGFVLLVASGNTVYSSGTLGVSVKCTDITTKNAKVAY
jgi:hypothetical protein